ncbi:histidine kinase N-terminal domain-containing protein [Alkalihalobacillus sp. CinArs1]|uniref:histidine kinase N-terminal domain-containing protein n=1 Tax=Alkalihalobacillus sp. CinArs1 TaxID=2995314 RepID=UPI0022DD1661|nr:histidine kinase N-terminal domain-containing protein [Alkalihalobacillus sp. CinArs1]
MIAQNQLVDYLDQNLDEYLNSWKRRVRISDDDIYKDKVVANGKLMYQLVRTNIVDPIDENKIAELAKQIARERVEANINIGDFIYNVNLGRSVLFDHMTRSDVSSDDLLPILQSFNDLFDTFAYHAVTEYTKIKSDELQEKISYIDETHQEKLSILGQMSSSFVHEFRNPLTAIMGFVAILRKENPEMKYLDVIEHELKQLNFRISQFLHVSKKEIDGVEEEEFEVGEVFNDMIDFIYPSVVDVDVHISNNIPKGLRIFGQKDKIRQVLLNIVMNSIDALKEIQRNRKINLFGEKLKGEMKLHISNNGPAIPEKKLDTIFEPFYTTKELGTGIGLYVCQKIIQNHNGQISCKSDQDETTFTITLPLC